MEKKTLNLLLSIKNYKHGNTEKYVRRVQGKNS